MILTQHGINSLLTGGYRQEWTEDENVDTSLDHIIPVDSQGMEVSLQSIMALSDLQTPEDDCGMEVSLQTVRKLTDMQTPEDDCGMDVSLVSIRELETET